MSYKSYCLFAQNAGYFKFTILLVSAVVKGLGFIRLFAFLNLGFMEMQLPKEKEYQKVISIALLIRKYISNKKVGQPMEVHVT